MKRGGLFLRSLCSFVAQTVFGLVAVGFSAVYKAEDWPQRTRRTQRGEDGFRAGAFCAIYVLRGGGNRFFSGRARRFASRGEIGRAWRSRPRPFVSRARVVKDAHGNVLADGPDSITVIKGLKLGGAQVLKAGSKAKNNRLVGGDHEIACKIGGVALALKACFVKKA
jgi:protein PhnA